VIVEHLVLGALQCNCTIVADETTREAVVVDGGDGVGEVVQRLASLGLRAKYLVHTHAHIDHIGDAGALRFQTGGAVLLHPEDLPLYRMLPLQAQWLGLPGAPQVVSLDGELEDGEMLRCGTIGAKILHTPGHTPGSVCLQLERNGAAMILSGDTLFKGSIGRWDLGGTSQEDIVASIRRKLLVYPDQTTVIPGHGPPTTIGIERRTNPFILGQ
jgi:hydroxyacylglutathione hydrolase